MFLLYYTHDFAYPFFFADRVFRGFRKAGSGEAMKKWKRGSPTMGTASSPRVTLW